MATPATRATKTEMHVTRAEDGTWCVISTDGVILASGMTNEHAWRWHDKANGEPTSIRESTAAWVQRARSSSL
jgi:hypothetical protein